MVVLIARRVHGTVFSIQSPFIHLCRGAAMLARWTAAFFGTHWKRTFCATGLQPAVFGTGYQPVFCRNGCQATCSPPAPIMFLSSRAVGSLAVVVCLAGGSHMCFAVGVTVTSPNGGEVYTAGTEIQISWDSDAGPQDLADFFVSTDSGANWSWLGYTYLALGQTPWMLPCEPSNGLRVWIIPYGTSGDASDDDASSVPGPPTGSIMVTSPNGGESFFVGDTIEIAWTTAGAVPVYGDFYISVDGGGEWSWLGTTHLSFGQTLWTLPCQPSNGLRVRIVPISSGIPCSAALSDESDSSASTTSPYVTVGTPNGGQTITAGGIQAITWATSGPTNGSVSLEYSINPGGTWVLITASTPNDGSYDWLVPNTPTTLGKVRVTAYPTCGGSVSDESDYVFFVFPNCDDGDECTADLVDPLTLGCVHWPLDCGECDSDGDCSDVPGFTAHCVDGECYYVPVVCLNVRPCEYRYVNPITGECDSINLCGPGLCCTDDGCLPCELNGDGVLDGLDIQPLIEAIMNGVIPPTALPNFYVPALLGMPLP